MDITWRAPEDRAELARRIGIEKNAKQRDRLRAVLLALEGQETLQIVGMLGRSRRFVQRWVYVYRDRGLAALVPVRQSGRPTRLTPAEQTRFKDRMLAGPTAADEGLCTLRGREARRILQTEFGKPYTLSGVYALLERLGLSCLRPRPRHRKNDLEAMARWLQGAPLLSRTSPKPTPRSRSKPGSRTKPGSASKAR